MKALMVLMLLVAGCTAQVSEPAKADLCGADWDVCVIGDGQPGAPVVQCESDGGHSYCTCTGRAYGEPVVAKCTIADQPQVEKAQTGCQ